VAKGKAIPGSCIRQPTTAPGAMLPSPLAPPTSGGWMSSWPASRTSCSPPFHEPNASS
jgi:hypothetical protein